MTKKLFVAGISWNTTEAALTELFATTGKVESANIIIDKYTGKSKGFGFVEMATEEDAQKAKQLDGKELDGRTLVVKEALPQQPRDNNYSGGGGFGGGRGNDRRDRDNNRRGGGGRY